MKRMWAVDVEGNGANPPEIVELGIVEMDDLQLTGNVKHWQFRPEHEITPAVSRIHGITNDDVADAPPIEDVIDDILLWLEESPIVGHNVRVELEALSRVLPDWKPAAAYDSLKVARALLPNEEKFGLERLGDVLGLNDAASLAVGGGAAHSGPYDAAMSAILLERLLSPLPQTERDKILMDADILNSIQGTLL
ncbi:exonuclease domain-containing protein [Lutimaribacter marinistellae]|uniref:Exonuclease domain-containing protein n=1 Tax=Lutimaribacter marinistellae TaxID=1820329 RepID=A0ABV7TBN8_9RHOB